MVEETGDERRREPRTPIALKVEYADAGHLVADFTANISTGGTFILTRRQLPTGTPLRLVLSFPGLIKPIPVSAVVKWHREAPEEAQGVGVEFENLPPEAQARLTELIARIAKGDPQLMVRHFKVLLVEDNPHVATLIREGLNAGGQRELGGRVTFDFTTVDNGRDALLALDERPFDIVITDIYLPVMDGVSLIKQIRERDSLAGIPIIAMSAGGPSTRDEARAAGADFFLSKPMRLTDIIATMRTLSRL